MLILIQHSPAISTMIGPLFKLMLILMNILNQILEVLIQEMPTQTPPSLVTFITIGPTFRNILNQISEVPTQETLIQIQLSHHMSIMTGLISVLLSPKNNSMRWVSNSSKLTNTHNQTSEVPTQEMLTQIPLSLPMFTTTGLTYKLVSTHNQTSEVPTQEIPILIAPSPAISTTTGPSE